MSHNPSSGTIPAIDQQWSRSRQSTFDECHRKHYWSAVAAPAGGRSDALPEARVARLLKNLTSLDFERGRILHSRTEEYAVAMRNETDLPGLRTMFRRNTEQINAAWRTRNRIAEWSANPSSMPMLMEAYYGRLPSAERRQAIKDQLESATRRIRSLELWPRLAACTAQDVLVIEKLSSYQLPVAEPTEASELVSGEASPRVTVWAAPDLVMRPSTESLIEITDAKSGRSDSSFAVKAMSQVTSYAVYLRHMLKLLGPDDACRGRVVFLGDGAECEWVIEPQDIDRAEREIRAGANAMWVAREFADQEAVNASLLALDGGASAQETRVAAENARRDAYPRTKERSRCTHCAFLAVCLPDEVTLDFSEDNSNHPFPKAA